MKIEKELKNIIMLVENNYIKENKIYNINF